jgi:DNA-directed RNA polymerases I and III subunit RPAC1
MPVYSRHLEWVPQGDQEERFGVNGVRPKHEDILLAKLRPGQVTTADCLCRVRSGCQAHRPHFGHFTKPPQSIKLEAFCEKGVAKDHAKFSPVATASYRLLPRIEVVQDLPAEDADALVKMCPMKVFDIEDFGSGDVSLGQGKKGKGKKHADDTAAAHEGAGAGGRKRVVAARPRDCTMCRECIRHDGWSEKVKLGRAHDHFIFKVESVGAGLKPHEIVKEAIAILKAKCETFLAHIDGASGSHGMEDGEEEGAAGGDVADML